MTPVITCGVLYFISLVISCVLWWLCHYPISLSCFPLQFYLALANYRWCYTPLQGIEHENVPCQLFLTFICFTSLREQDEAFIYSSWWLTLVGLDPAYTSRSTTMLRMMTLSLLYALRVVIFTCLCCSILTVLSISFCCQCFVSSYLWSIMD